MGKLRKALRKDSVNAGARYVMACYFFDHRNPQFHVDSAYQHLMDAFRDYALATLKQRERLKRIPVDSTLLTGLRQRIDSAAFRRARDIHTEDGYLLFLQQFQYALQRDQAVELRNEVAFESAATRNTYRAFDEFLKKYPNARQAREARERYDKLLFESLTQDGTLAGYESLIRKFPQSPYRPQAERQIYELSTAPGTMAAFLHFLTKYPANGWRQQALNVVYHLARDHGDENDLETFLTDSLRVIGRLNEGYLAPVLKNDLFGFIDSHGRDVIQPVAHDLGTDYLCGNVTEDILVLGNKAMARNGKVIFEGDIEELDDAGSGFLRIISSGCVTLVHKSGFSIGEGCFSDAKIVARRFAALKTFAGWHLYTLTGRRIEGTWSDVKGLADVVALKMDGQWNLITCNRLAEVVNGAKMEFTNPFDEVKPWQRELVWVRQRDREGLLDGQLNFRIPLDRQTLKPEFFGITSSSAQGIKVYDSLLIESGYFQQIKVTRPWLAVQQEAAWRLFDPSQQKYLSHPFVNIDFTGLFAVGYHGDSVRVFFDSAQHLDFVNVKLEFLPAKDSNSFIVVTEGEKKSVYNSRAVKLLTLSSRENVQYAEGGLFIITRDEKKGLMNSQGKVLIPVEMDAIGNLAEEVVPLLKGMKFGLYNIKERKLIKPAYDKNLVVYGDQYLVAFREGAYGFVQWNNKPVSSFEYQEVRFWNAATALVKKDSRWMLFDIVSGKVVMDNITDYYMVHDAPTEKVAIVRQDNQYGVVSSVRGVVIPVNFSDIVNIGSSEEPLYFTEKHVAEASLFVVIYYDSDGKLLRRQVFEPDDYERIYCPKK